MALPVRGSTNPATGPPGSSPFRYRAQPCALPAKIHPAHRCLCSRPRSTCSKRSGTTPRRHRPHRPPANQYPAHQPPKTPPEDKSPFPILRSQHLALCTSHSASCILNLASCTLHLPSCTLHLVPRILHLASFIPSDPLRTHPLLSSFNSGHPLRPSPDPHRSAPSGYPLIVLAADGKPHFSRSLRPRLRAIRFYPYAGKRPETTFHHADIARCASKYHHTLISKVAQINAHSSTIDAKKRICANGARASHPPFHRQRAPEPGQADHGRYRRCRVRAAPPAPPTLR